MRPQIGFLFLGGAHQILHIAPVAMELAAGGAVTVRLLAAGEEERVALIGLWGRLGLSAPEIELLPRPRWARLLARFASRATTKLVQLFAARALLCRLDAVVAAERTCTILKRLPGAKPYLIHIPHGAGDRARGFEARIRLFDHVIVAGEKDRERLVAEGICRAADVSVSGYVKLAAVRRLQARSGVKPIFADDRPVILYNPHFTAGLSSWHRFAGPLIAAFAQQDRFNLIVAPHVRLFENAPAAERRAVEARAVPGRIHIDLGSACSNDMSYTLAADLYVGDVSSQVYEFLQAPGPCLFLDAEVGEWRTQPSFAFWHLGEVIADPADVLAGVARALETHAQFRPAQVRACERALGPTEPDPMIGAARIVARLAVARAAAGAQPLRGGRE